MKGKNIFKKIMAGALTVTLCVGSVFTGAEPLTVQAATRFKDIASHWGEAAINYAADMGMVKGDEQGRYNPDANITRAEFVSVLNNIFLPTAKADLSEFSDVDAKKWYYENLQKAYFMETIWGKAGGELAPNDPVTREDAILGIAVAMELSSDNSSVLNKFTDGTVVSADAKKGVSAMVAAGYVNGFPVQNGKTTGYALKPNANLTRAEIAAIFTNMITEVYVSSKSYAGRTIDKCMVVNQTAAEIKGATINGDLVLGDGVGEIGAIIENTVIKGRLIVRGGGENSIYLNNTIVEGGTIVNSLSTGVRLVTEGYADPGIVTAKTSTTLDGDGFISLQVPASAKEGSTFNIWNASLDSVDINAPRSLLNIANTSDVRNVRFSSKAGNSSMTLARNASVEYLGIDAMNVTVTGSGDIGELQVNALGASCAITPDLYNINNNLSATINGRNRSGSNYAGPGQNEVVRDTEGENLYIDVDSPSVINSTMVTSSTSNIAYLTAKSGTRIGLTLGNDNSNYTYNNERYAYWIVAEVPAPSGYSSSATVLHSMDGQLKSYDYAVRSGVMRLSIPVTKAINEAKGSINERFYIDWGSYDEVLDVRASNIPLAELTSAEENMLISQFNQAYFTGCDGLEYYGSEALKRLLTTDNPLGLDLRGYKSYDPADQNYLAVRLLAAKDTLTSRAQIQKMLVLETSRKGALYLVNNATRGEEIRDVLDDEIYATELTVDTSDGSKYASLSQRGRIELGKAIIAAKKSDFADAVAFRAAYDKALETVLKTETTLLNALNSAASASALRKVYETAANAAFLGLAVSSEPYTLFPAAQKDQIASDAFSMLPFADLDEARAILVGLIGVDVDESLIDVVVSAIVLDNNTATLTVGDDWSVKATIRTSTGDITADSSNSTWTIDKSAVASIRGVGHVEGVAEGSAKLTVTSKFDAKKTATATVKVVKSVPATGITIDSSTKTISVGDVISLRAGLTPATATDKVTWGSDDSSVASVTGTSDKNIIGSVTGVNKGFANISARVSGADSPAFCSVVVLPETPDILIDQEDVTIGIGGELQLRAYVAPITTLNKNVIWKSENTNIVTVDASGFIRGVAEGEANVIAQSAAYPDVTVICRVTVDERSGVMLDKTNLDMYPNGIDRLVATVFPLDGEVSWRVDNDQVLKVVADPDVENGAIITALKSGTARVIATAKDDTSAMASCLVTVSSGKLAFTINPTKYSMTNDPDNQILLQPTFNPRPSNLNVNWMVQTGQGFVTVDQAGVVRPKSAGTATVVGVPEADQTLKVTCTITVTEIPVTAFTAPDSLSILLNDKLNIQYNLQPGNATNQEVTWYTTNLDTLIVHPGRYPYTTDADKPKVEGIKTTTTTYVAIITPERVEYRDTSTGAVYTTPPSSGAIVGMLEEKIVPAVTEVAIKDTPAKLVGTASNGKTVTINVTVLPLEGQGQVNNVNINLDTWVYPVGAQQNMTVRFNVDAVTGEESENQPSNKKVTWTSDTESVATVEPGTGVLKAVAPGIARISVLSDDGAKSDSKIIVVAPKALTNIGFTYDPSSTDYGNFFESALGAAPKNVNAQVTADATDKRLYYRIESVDANKVATGEDAHLDIDASGRIITEEIGIFKVTATSRQKSAYGQAKPGDSNVIFDDAMSSALNMEMGEYVNSQLTSSGGIYYGPNRPSSVTPTLSALVDTNIIPLVIQNPAKPVSFYVWVKPIQVNDSSKTYLADNRTPSVTLGTTPVKVFMPTTLTSPADDEKMKVRLNIDPVNATMDMDSLKWVITGDGAENITVSGVQLMQTKNDLGEITAQYILADVIGGTKTGEATITMTISSKAGEGLRENGGSRQQKVAAVTLTRSFKLDVQPRAATSLTLAAPAGTWYIGDHIDLATSSVVTISPANASINTLNPAIKDRLTWSSSSTSIASITADGVLTFNGTGSAIISATLKSVGAENASVPVATMTVSCIGVSNGGITGGGITSGAATGVKAPVVPGNVSTAGVSVPGTTTPGGATTPATTTGTAVTQTANQSLSIDSATVTPIAQQQALNTTLGNVPANLEQTGLVMAVPNTVAAAEKKDSSGAVVTASQTAQQKARAVKPLTKNVAGKAAITAITMRTTANVIQGDIVQLMPVVTPALADTSTITWTSADPKIATVDKNGIVTGVTAGKSVKITAKAANGKSAVTTVTVQRATTIAPLVGIKINKTSLELGTGNSSTLSVTYNPTNTKVKGVTWYSSDYGVATVDRSGAVKGVAGGKATITAVSDDGGKIATCEVTVVAKPTAIKVAVPSTSMKAGTKQQATYTVTPTDATNVAVTWKSSNSKIATVSSTGEITAHAAGTIFITVTTTVGSKSSSVAVKVTK